MVRVLTLLHRSRKLSAAGVVGLHQKLLKRNYMQVYFGKDTVIANIPYSIMLLSGCAVLRVF